MIFFDVTVALILRCVARLLFSKEITNLLGSVTSLKNSHLAHVVGDFDPLTRALIAAEDRRFLVHRGIDLKGLVRACVMFLRTGEIQGGSTVTQQLVRVLTEDYRFSFQRKFKEMCLACMLDKRVSKHEQARLYLQCAYFGWQMNGLNQVAVRLGLSGNLTDVSAANIVARLRYPQPKNAGSAYFEKMQKRANYIVAVMNLQG
jgi:membrane carboxypeptidase/penicillin-binding protein